MVVRIPHDTTQHRGLNCANPSFPPSRGRRECYRFGTVPRVLHGACTTDADLPADPILELPRPCYNVMVPHAGCQLRWKEVGMSENDVEVTSTRRENTPHQAAFWKVSGSFLSKLLGFVRGGRVAAACPVHCPHHLPAGSLQRGQHGFGGARSAGVHGCAAVQLGPVHRDQAVLRQAQYHDPHVHQYRQSGLERCPQLPVWVRVPSRRLRTCHCFVHRSLREHDAHVCCLSAQVRSSRLYPDFPECPEDRRWYIDHGWHYCRHAGPGPYSATHRCQFRLVHDCYSAPAGRRGDGIPEDWPQAPGARCQEELMRLS